MSQAKNANRSANAHIIHLLQLAMSESTQRTDVQESEKIDKQPHNNVESRLAALENTVNKFEEDFASILEKLDDQT